jgi:hypothetical protein
VTRAAVFPFQPKNFYIWMALWRRYPSALIGCIQTTILRNVATITKNRHILARSTPILFVCLVMKMIVSEGWRYEYSETARAAAE